MAAAANFGFCNRQVITQRVRGVWRRAFGGGSAGQLRLLYDVAHNTAKIERHGNRNLCVHRKGATRAFGPSASELPAAYRGVGQPVLIPGSMGTASFVLVGTDQAAELTWSSSCHGAGRAMSRGAAKRAITGQELRRQLAARGSWCAARPTPSWPRRRRWPTRTSTGWSTWSTGPGWRARWSG